MNDHTPTPPRMTDQAPELLPCKEAHDIIVAYFDAHGINDAHAGAFNILDQLKIAGLVLTRPTPAERPVPHGLEQRADAVDMPATIGELEQMICIEFPSSVATRHAAERVYNFLYARISIRAKTLARRPTASGLPLSEGQAEECDSGSRPVPQVREVEHLLADIIANETYADNDGVAGISAAAEAICKKFEINPLTSARPSDAAVAWRYRHKDTEGWLMLKNGRDPTEWLKQWPNTEYEVEALVPMRPEAADEIERLRNQLVKANAMRSTIEDIISVYEWCCVDPVDRGYSSLDTEISRARRLLSKTDDYGEKS